MSKKIDSLLDISGMVGMQPLVEFLLTVLWTGRVVGEKPVSVILVAAPGHGKTTVLSKLKTDATYFTDDLTSREISKALTECPDMTHLILSDMTSIFNRKASTADLTCNALRRLIEEGSEVDSFTGKHQSAKRIGFITAIPPDDLGLRKVDQQLKEGGFASRFIVANYSYSQQTKRDIHAYIRSDAYTKPSTNGNVLHLPERTAAVEIPAKLASDLNLLAHDIKRDPLGARAHHHLRALLKARTLECNRLIATAEDFRRVTEYAEFFTKSGKVL